MEKILIKKGILLKFEGIIINPLTEIVYDISDEGLKQLLNNGYKLKKVFYYWEFE